jgi:very-short-patch-repair endonuclease
MSGVRKDKGQDGKLSKSLTVDAPLTRRNRERPFGYYRADPFYYGMLEENAKNMRNMPTDAERRLWEFLRGKQLGLRFRRQYVVYQYIADFVCLPLNLIVEVDGEVHEHELNAEHDALRTRFLESKGFHLIRFRNEEVLTNIEQVIRKIKDKMYELASPSPSEGGDSDAGQSLPKPLRGRG